jgi:hypothetical protein
MVKKPDAAAVKTRVVALSDLVPDPGNVRVHPERNREAVASSVKALGAARSIVIDGEGVVRAGNGTLEAAKAAGITEAVVVETDGRQLVVVKRPDWTPEQAIAYAIADNRTNELSYFDTQALSIALSQLVEHAVEKGDRSLVDAASFNEKELEALLALPAPVPETTTVRSHERTVGAVDPKSEWAGMPTYEHEDKRAWRSVVVHFKDAEALAEFERRAGVAVPEKARYLWFPEIEIGHYADKTYASES